MRRPTKVPGKELTAGMRKLRQESPKNELNLVFPQLSREKMAHNLFLMYGVSHQFARGYPLGVIFNVLSRTSSVQPGNYMDLLQAFFPILHEDDKESPRGYTLSEIANVLNARWWMGDVSDDGFRTQLKANRNYLFVRRSGSDRSAFVFGRHVRGEKEPTLWKFSQSNNMIIARGIEYRNVEDLYYDWGDIVTAITVRQTSQFGTGRVASSPISKPIPSFVSSYDHVTDDEEVSENEDWSRWI